MDPLAAHFDKAQRLSEITQRVGFTLWQLQELEGVATTYFVLLAEAKRGMGTDAGEILVAKAQGRTFGVTIRQLKTAGLLTAELEQRFRKLLSERNWLVHSSRADSRAAVHSNSEFGALLFRLDRIAEEALALLREIGGLTKRHVISHGVFDTGGRCRDRYTAQEMARGRCNLTTQSRRTRARAARAAHCERSAPRGIQ